MTVRLRLFDVDDPKYTGPPVDCEAGQEPPEYPPEAPRYVNYNDNQCNDRTAGSTSLGASFHQTNQVNTLDLNFDAGGELAETL